ncbi:hypothetical protein CTAYLR_007882 [Chrysophaeum taylorii]|uniref:histone acetyltransferase n=1 Tax=Chrysophaeum taylorii TaxID=2483200 RepID=A0AAD7XQP7_9STRA|nr:hypothetical protein CTAYLR_007882 [Chrysophaeum taylorii]
MDRSASPAWYDAARHLQERKKMLTILVALFRRSRKATTKLAPLVQRVEGVLFVEATSLAEYQDRASLKHRLEAIHGRALSQQRVRRAARASLMNSLAAEHAEAHANLVRGLQKSSNKANTGGRKHDACALCGEQSLFFRAPVVRCSSCSDRLRKKASVYSDGKRTLCHACFRKVVDGKSALRRLAFENEPDEEPWVQCASCKIWVHQICGLFNGRTQGDVPFYCRGCFASKFPRWSSEAPTARVLPESDLSTFLELRLRSVLGAEARVRVREASKTKESHAVKPRFAAAHPSYPRAFRATARCVVLFQEIDGVDVLLFGMYVYEYGADCPEPNRGRVYLSYLDSVNHWRGADRTRVYRELLVSYLEHAKRRGFHAAHIWACPPTKGDDFIFFCHPQDQKIPTKQRLKEWYQSLLEAARARGVVARVSTFWDACFEGRSNMLDIPYFQGDYWTDAAEDFLNDVLEPLASGGPTKKRRKVAVDEDDDMIYDDAYARRHRTVVDPPRQPDLKAELGKWMKMKGTKDTFIVAYLRDDRALVLADPDDKITMRSAIFATRQHYLNFCRVNHYQFDDLRHAKHSSMMTLHHMLHPEVLDTLDHQTPSPPDDDDDALAVERPRDVWRLRLLEHAADCKEIECTVPKCTSMKSCLRHVLACRARDAECPSCRKVVALLNYHARVRGTDALRAKFVLDEIPPKRPPTSVARLLGEDAPGDDDDSAVLAERVAHALRCDHAECEATTCSRLKAVLRHRNHCDEPKDRCADCRDASILVRNYNHHCAMQHHVQHVKHAATCHKPDCDVAKCNELKALLRHPKACDHRDTCKQCDLARSLMAIFLRHRRRGTKRPAELREPS